MSKATPETFRVGQAVVIFEHGSTAASYGYVSSKIGSDLRFMSTKGHQKEFGYVSKLRGWKALFSGMAGELCFSSGAPTYRIIPAFE